MYITFTRSSHAVILFASGSNLAGEHIYYLWSEPWKSQGGNTNHASLPYLLITRPIHEFIWTFFEAVPISSLYQFWRSLVEAIEITERNQERAEQIIKHIHAFFPLDTTWINWNWKPSSGISSSPSTTFSLLLKNSSLTPINPHIVKGEYIFKN